MVKKFVPFDCSQEFIPLLDFLEKLEAATNFNPKKDDSRSDNLLWDYQKLISKHGKLTPIDLEREDVRLLKRQIWVDLAMPQRFISETDWGRYQTAFDNSPLKPDWELCPTFVPNPGKKISTWSHHFFKLKNLVAAQLKKGFNPILNSAKAKSTLKNFGAGTLISVSLIALPYIDSDIDFLGEPPNIEESKKAKLHRADDELLNALRGLKLNPEDLPKEWDGGVYKAKERAWLIAREITNLFPTKAIFDMSWRRLKRAGKIKYHQDD